REIDPSFPAEVEAIILKAMAMDPRNRYQTASALAEDILRHLDGRRPEIPIPPPPPAPPPQRKKGGRTILVLATVLLLAGVGTFAWRAMPAPPPAPPIARPSDPAPSSPESTPKPVTPPKEVPVEAG